MLSLHNVDAGYGGKAVLQGVSLEVPQGAIVTLLGANGAGKSTTLKSIVGLVQPTRGTIQFEGKPIPNKRPDQALRNGVSLVAEQRELFLSMSVADNLRLGGIVRRDAKEAKADFEYLFDVFPRLRERSAQQARTLSGGEQQMLAIARSLMARPKLLLLDEPSLGLAPQLVDDMFRIIRQINANGTTILLVEQNVVLALEVATYGYVMETGVITLEGDAETLRQSSAIQASYL
jgi:branched-chain amino acid transport system ATP-binding protein